MEYMLQQAVKLDYKMLLDNKSKFVLCHSSSGFKHSLKGKPYSYVMFIWFDVILALYASIKNV